MINQSETVHIQVPSDVSELQPPRRLSTASGRLEGSNQAYVTDEDAIRYGFPEGMISRQQELYSLSSADEIAQFFRKNDIKGERGNLNSCPIATYSRSLGLESCEVDKLGVSFESNGMFIRFNASLAMQEFVRNFDNGLYPDLVA